MHNEPPLDYLQFKSRARGGGHWDWKSLFRSVQTITGAETETLIVEGRPRRSPHAMGTDCSAVMFWFRPVTRWPDLPAASEWGPFRR